MTELSTSRPGGVSTSPLRTGAFPTVPDAGHAPRAAAPPLANPGATVHVGEPASDEVVALWPGDRGSLRAATRSALARLVRGPYVSAEKDPEAWRALLAGEEHVRSRLADLYLELVLDTDTGVAFVRRAPADEAKNAVRELPLTFLDTALLLHLRGRLLDAADGRAVVGRDEVGDALAGYRRRSGVDGAEFARLLDASWDRMFGRGLLEPTTTEGRFEVSPVLRVLFGAEQVAAVQAEYARLAKEKA